MAPIDVVQAQAQAATALQNLVVAQAHACGPPNSRSSASSSTARRIRTGTRRSIRLTGPISGRKTIDLDAAIRRALSQRTDLAIAQKNVQANDVTLKYLDDQTKPQADLIANYGLTGIGGTQLMRTGSGIGGDEPSDAARFPAATATRCRRSSAAASRAGRCSVNISYPLGLSTQQAAVARARVQLEPGAGAAEADRAADRDRSHQRGDHVRSNVERVQAAQVGARAGPAAARRREQQVRGRACPRTTSSSRRRTSWRRRRTTSSRRF